MSCDCIKLGCVGKTEDSLKELSIMYEEFETEMYKARELFYNEEIRSMISAELANLELYTYCNNDEVINKIYELHVNTDIHVKSICECIYHFRSFYVELEKTMDKFRSIFYNICSSVDFQTLKEYLCELDEKSFVEFTDVTPMPYRPYKPHKKYVKANKTNRTIPKVIYHRCRNNC